LANVKQVDALYKAILQARGQNLDSEILFKLKKLYKGASKAVASTVI
jgi:hypothetical protein